MRAGILIRVFVGIVLLGVGNLWAQVAASGGAEAAATGPSDDGGAMVTPAPVSGEGYSAKFTSETGANYVRGGLIFTTAYDSAATTGTNGQPIGEVSYSVWPTISLDQTRSRLHWDLSYSPGFTFYQKTSSLNQANQNLGVNLSYRLSPHVTLTLQDSFKQTSSVLTQPSSNLEQPVSGGVFVPNYSLIAPNAELLRNTANATLTYQFGANAMVGASGAFTNLHYPNPDQVPGLYDSSSRGGSAFYTHRLSKTHYIGATYQYQAFFSYPNGSQSETQTQSVVLFYSLYLKPTFTISVFSGPQYSETVQFGAPAISAWSPVVGASMSWQGKLTSFAASCSRAVHGGDGLIGAAQSNSANGVIRRQLTRTLGMSILASYTSNSVLDELPTFSTGGHTILGTASVQRPIGGHLNLQLQYTRLHQSYSDIAAISSTPNRNLAAVTISYQFARPLGR